MPTGETFNLSAISLTEPAILKFMFSISDKLSTLFRTCIYAGSVVKTAIISNSSSDSGGNSLTSSLTTWLETVELGKPDGRSDIFNRGYWLGRSEEHTSELQS